MHVRRTPILGLLVLALAATACSSVGSGGVSVVPSAFKADEGKAATLDVSSTGGVAAVRSGDSTVAVWVPAGAAVAGSKWRVVPLTEAPSGVKKPLCPGVYVDTAGSTPTSPCAIGFSLPGTASPDATIVRVSDDGKSTEVVATDRVVSGGRTILTAHVDGFSSYTTAEEDAAARDKAAVDKAKAKGQQADWTIKVVGTEQKTVEGWTMDYEFDLFASGGGVEQAGTYKGHAMLSLEGKYKGPASIVKTFGTVSGIGRDQSLTFTIVEPSLRQALGGGEAPDSPQVDGSGTMNLEGMSSIDLTAVGPTATGKANEKNVKGSGGVPFTIAIKGEDVQVEISGLGIFPGKILRTSK